MSDSEQTAADGWVYIDHERVADSIPKPTDDVLTVKIAEYVGLPITDSSPPPVPEYIHRWPDGTMSKISVGVSETWDPCASSDQALDMAVRMCDHAVFERSISVVSICRGPSCDGWDARVSRHGYDVSLRDTSPARAVCLCLFAAMEIVPDAWKERPPEISWEELWEKLDQNRKGAAAFEEVSKVLATANEAGKLPPVIVASDDPVHQQIYTLIEHDHGLLIVADGILGRLSILAGKGDNRTSAEDEERRALLPWVDGITAPLGETSEERDARQVRQHQMSDEVSRLEGELGLSDECLLDLASDEARAQRAALRRREIKLQVEG